MSTSPDLLKPSEDFGARLAHLSNQERAVLDLATKGQTDEQIAQALGLSVATVNSYWVRVRGKLGHQSRVELVVALLRHQTHEAHLALRAENRRLQERVVRVAEENHELRAILTVLQGEAWHGMALACSPEATLVTRPPATVVFANRRARSLYRADTGELEGLPMRDLSLATSPAESREPCRDLFREGGPECETVGIEDPYFARRIDGSNFRAVLRAERFHVAESPFAVVTVREYMAEAENILRTLRQPFAADDAPLSSPGERGRG